MSRNILSVRFGAHASLPKTHTFEEPAVSERSVLPRITMPKTGPRIFFWRGGAASGETPCPTTAERIALLRQRLSCHRAALSTIEDRIVSGSLTAEEMRAEHATLSDLLRKVSVEAARIKTIRETLQARQERFLSSWRVTEREILATDSREVHREVRSVLCRIKRCQVDVSGRLLEQV